MNKISLQTGQGDTVWTPQNIWSSLTPQFRAFEQKILNIISQKNGVDSQLLESDKIWERTDSKYAIKKEIQVFEKGMKKKLGNIMFQSSVNQSLSDEKNNKISELKRKLIEEGQNHEGKVRDLKEKIQSFEKLVRIYEKALSQSKNTPASTVNHSKQISITQSTLDKYQPQKQANKIDKLLKFYRIYSIKIENNERSQKQNSVSGSNLSYSRLTSSRMSSSLLDGGALKQLETNWNKSVNVSNRSLKSGAKGNQKSMRRQEKSFVKSHIKQKELNKSSIKANHTSSKMNRQNCLNQSTISQFCLHKN